MIVRAFRPGAATVRALLPDRDRPTSSFVHPAASSKVSCEGVSCRSPTGSRSATRAGTFTFDDPYRFLPTIGDVDLHLFNEGRHEELWEKLGAHVRDVDGVAGDGVRRLGAECAARCQRGRRLLRLGWPPVSDAPLGTSGRLGALRARASRAGALYKFEILTRDGASALKTDPFAFAMRAAARAPRRSCTASDARWDDDEWMAQRRDVATARRPMSIYEVHLGSWGASRARATAR